MENRPLRASLAALSTALLMTISSACVITLPSGGAQTQSAAAGQSAAQQSAADTAVQSAAQQSTAAPAGSSGAGSAGAGGAAKQEGSGKIDIPGSFDGKSILNAGKYKLTKIFKPGDRLFDRILGSSGSSGGSTPSQFALTSKDAGTPVLSFLGHGYDVFDNYASARYVKEGRILDTEKLLGDGKIFRHNLSESDYKEVTSSNARSYATSVATSVKLSGSYLYFSGSVKANFSSSHLEQANHFFSTIFYKISLYSLYIDPAVKLSDYVRKDAQDILETRDAKWIFENYGTHLLRSLQAGGRFDYNTSVDKKYVKDESSFSTSVKASFNAVFASAGASVQTSSATTTEEFSENSEIRIFTYGGDGIDGQSMKSDPQTLKKWMQTVKTTPSISDFGDNAFVPIWEFCKTEKRKKYLEAAFDKYAKEKLTIVPSSFAVNALRLSFVNVLDPVINEFSDSNGEWHLVSNISAHTMKSDDKMAVLYCRYGRADDTNNAPVVEIVLQNDTEKESALAYFQKKYKDDKTAKLFGMGGSAYLDGSYLSEPINQEIARAAGAPVMYLFYVTSQKASPVKSVILRHVAPNGETAYFPHAPEENKKYERILDQTSLKFGKAVPQDTGEGAGNWYKKSWLVYKNHFIEYTRD